MISKQRKIRFFIFSLVFVILAPFILFYAFGNGFSNGNIFKTGGIYVITSEPDCEIYLDGKLKKTSNFFQRSFLIKNLSAKEYSILVKKNGFNSWSKEVTVFNSLVAEVKPFMIPVKVELREIPKLIESTNSVGTTTKKNLEYDNVLKFFDTTEITTNIKQKALVSSSTEIKLGTEDNPISYRNVGIWKNENKIYATWLGKRDAIIDDFCDRGNCKFTVEVFDFKENIKKFDFFMGDRQAILVLLNDCLSAVEIQVNNEKKLQKIYCGTELDIFLENNSYLYIKDGEILFEVLI